MTKTSSIPRKLLAFVLVTVMAITAFSTQAFAAGVETWYASWVSEGTITIRNNNLTPVKTMGTSGTLHIVAQVSGRPDMEPSGCPPVKLTVQVRDLSGNVLASGSVSEDATVPQVHINLPVSAGQQIQIFFDISSVSYNPNGNYRIADVTYGHEIY